MIARSCCSRLVAQLIVGILLYASTVESDKSFKYKVKDSGPRGRPQTSTTSSPKEPVTLDKKGYIIYKSDAVLFDKQVDHFLGALSFAKRLDRTLILPMWDFKEENRTLRPMDFSHFFQVASLEAYHRVIVGKDFFNKEIADQIWPNHSRILFCYGLHPDQEEDGGCDAAAKRAFNHHEDHTPLLWSDEDIPGWKERYPAVDYPVLAFSRTPADYPITGDIADLHKYLSWSKHIDMYADMKVILRNLQEPFVGIHLIFSDDWPEICGQVKEGEKKHLLASAQCTGSQFEYGVLTKEMCHPKGSIIISQLKQMIKRYSIKSVYIVRDDPKYDDLLESELEKLDVKHYKVDNMPFRAPLDLAVLARSDYYIGNCVSPSSAFVTRERQLNNREVHYWAFDQPMREEL